VEERGNDLERREDRQLDGSCLQRRLVVQADAAAISRRCRAAFAKPCALHVLEAGWSARDQLPRLDQGGEAEFHVGKLDRSETMAACVASDDRLVMPDRNQQSIRTSEHDDVVQR